MSLAATETDDSKYDESIDVDEDRDQWVFYLLKVESVFLSDL